MPACIGDKDRQFVPELLGRRVDPSRGPSVGGQVRQDLLIGPGAHRADPAPCAPAGLAAPRRSRCPRPHTNPPRPAAPHRRARRSWSGTGPGRPGSPGRSAADGFDSTSASDCAGFSPMTYKPLSSPRSMASNMRDRCQPPRGGTAAPQTASNFLRACGSSTFWNPGSLSGRAPMSPPPWTLFCPRTGTRPDPYLPTCPVRSARLMSASTLSVPLWCSVMPRVQHSWAVGAFA